MRPRASVRADVTARLTRNRAAASVPVMYPVLRLFLTLHHARRAAPLGLHDTDAFDLTCRPWDADMFVEMNNGRILTLYDLGRFHLSVRIGLWDRLKENDWGLVVAGSSVRYRQRIRPFQRFRMKTRFLGWDQRFFYLEQGMYRGETCCNHALLRTGVTEKGRLAPVEKVARAMGVSPDPPALPDWVRAWAEADATRPWPPGL
jgi:acyl-CoA thioesterase FadM